LNLFDLADNDLYHEYSRRSPGVEPRQVMILVEWLSQEAFDAFLEDPENTDLHPLREDGTRNYLWWTYERLENLRPLFGRGSAGGF
jgi:heme-degrading monooxygenase HmoA